MYPLFLFSFSIAHRYSNVDSQKNNQKCGCFYSFNFFSTKLRLNDRSFVIKRSRYFGISFIRFSHMVRYCGIKKDPGLDLFLNKTQITGEKSQPVLRQLFDHFLVGFLEKLVFILCYIPTPWLWIS